MESQVFLSGNLVTLGTTNVIRISKNQTCLKIMYLIGIILEMLQFCSEYLREESDMPNGDISNLLYLNEPWRYYYKMCYFPMVVCCTLMSG